MLIKFDEQIAGDFLVPAFALSEGEIAIVQFPNGPFFYPLTIKMVELLEGKTNNNRVKIISPLKYVEHFKESKFRRCFYPTTVGEYLCKRANLSNPVCKKIYDTKWMGQNIQVKTLAGNLKHQLTLYTTSSWTNHIIFDLVGVDPQGGQGMYDFLKTITGSGGSIIMLEHSDEFKNDCTTFIQARYPGVR